MKELVYAAHYSLLQGPRLWELFVKLWCSPPVRSPSRLRRGLCYILEESVSRWQRGTHLRVMTPPSRYGQTSAAQDTHLPGLQPQTGEHMRAGVCATSHMSCIQTHFFFSNRGNLLGNILHTKNKIEIINTLKDQKPFTEFVVKRVTAIFSVHLSDTILMLQISTFYFLLCFKPWLNVSVYHGPVSGALAQGNLRRVQTAVNGMDGSPDVHGVGTAHGLSDGARVRGLGSTLISNL